MLVLARRVGEEVIIGDPRNPIGSVKVVKIQGDQVRLAFEFPRQVEVNRKEVAEERAGR